MINSSLQGVKLLSAHISHCSADRLSPFKFYQFLLTNTTDKDVIKFLRMLTFISLDDIETLEKEMSSSDYKPNTAQKILAREVTQFVHGPEGLKQAEAATQVRALSHLSSWHPSS